MRRSGQKRQATARCGATRQEAELSCAEPSASPAMLGNLVHVVSRRYHRCMTMTLRLDAEDDAELTALAKAQGISKNEAATRAIRESAARLNRESLLEAALSDTLNRYSDTLRRLGE